MGGSSKTIDTTPYQTQQFRKQVQDYIMNPTGPGTATAPNAPGRVQIMGGQPVSTTFNSGTDISRGGVRDIQSVDQLGGANSAFFKNMMSQLSPSFQQARTDAAAAGKEATGSLTGSGLGNSIGSNLNRTLGNQQATLANYATQGMQSELQRQQANQGADISFMNNILQRNNQGLQAQQMASQAQQFNSGQQAALGQNQAQLDAARNAMIYGGQLSTNQQNANNFLQLLGQQASLGVGPDTVQQTPGFGSFAGQLGGMAIGSMMGPIGSAVGAQVGKKLFG
jgi:hypothetical protein